MLQFFRKYQKFFFVIVTFFIVISFSFFGTFGTFSQKDELPDREIGRLIDGSVLKEQKWNGFLRFLQHGLEEGGRTTNLLNDSVLHKDLILSGLGEILAEHFFEKIQPDLVEKWARIKQYSPYVHPFAPHINARSVWGQMAPQINELLARVKEAPAVFSQEQLSLIFALYAAQAEFPPISLLQMLYYQQMQGDSVRLDEGLPNANVGLFGFQTIEDWFGSTFLEEMGKFLLNAACIAREEGYVVKTDEAQVDLFRNIYHAITMFQKGNSPSQEETHRVFLNQVHSLGLNEASAIEYWKEVLLFRRLFYEVGESVFFDRLAMQQFKNFARPSYKICRYHLPEELGFSSFREMLKFQRYIEVAFEGDFMSLPTKKRAMEEILDEHPQLVFKPFEVEIATVTKQSIADQVSLKQTWNWEGEEENFAKMQEKFPQLANQEAHSLIERMEILDGLDERVRFAIDLYAREALVDMHPEWIDEALANAPMEQKTLQVRLKGGDNPLSGQHFLALLETEDASLLRYTTDKKSFYSVRVIKKGEGWHLLSFEEANSDATLDEMLDSLLQTAYEDLDFEEPFEQMRDEVGAMIYADLLQSIGEKEHLESYAQHRFDRVLEKAKQQLMQNSEEFEKLQKESLWPLQKETDLLAEEDTTLYDGEFSPIAKGQFYQLLEKNKIDVSDSELTEAKEYLKRDAEQKLMRKLLERF